VKYAYHFYCTVYPQKAGCIHYSGFCTSDKKIDNQEGYDVFRDNIIAKLKKDYTCFEPKELNVVSLNFLHAVEDPPETENTDAGGTTE
jgi:hypothetical protein